MKGAGPRWCLDARRRRAKPGCATEQAGAFRLSTAPEFVGRAKHQSVLICYLTYMSSLQLDGVPFRLPESPSSTDLVAKYFRALGDPTRVQILELLAAGEHSAGEIVKHVGLPQPRVSNHLACLRWCGFVVTRREHRLVYYQLADQRVSELIGTARCLLADNDEHVAACRKIDDPAG